MLIGVGVSKGYARGRAQVLRSLEDIGKADKGNIVVIPYSDVGWTPAFLNARAVVSEAGGILSHAAIIAREIGIPAVVSVNGAMSIKDGSMLEVNGYSGEIKILEN